MPSTLEDATVIAALQGDRLVHSSNAQSSPSTMSYSIARSSLSSGSPATLAYSSARSPPMAGSPYSGRMLNQQIDYAYKAPARIQAEDAIPSRHELFILGDGEKKVEMKVDTRVPSAAWFTFNKEDHTLGNMLRSRLLQSPIVTFAAYKVPHPLFPTFELRVQTNGEITPKEAVIQACEDLVKDLGNLSRQFTKEWELRKIVSEGPQQQQQQQQNGGGA